MNLFKRLEEYFKNKYQTSEAISETIVYENRLKKTIFFMLSLILILFLTMTLLSLYIQKVIALNVVYYIYYLVFFLMIIAGIFILPYHPKTYGLNFHRFFFNFKTGLVIGLISFIAIIIIRLLVTRFGFKQLAFDTSIFLPSALHYIFVYPIIAFVQETVIKGFFQSYFFALFDSFKHKTFMAVFLSSFLFAIFHIFFGMLIAFFSFLYAISTGFLYEKSRSIISVLIIHYLTGVALFIMCRPI